MYKDAKKLFPTVVAFLFILTNKEYSVFQKQKWLAPYSAPCQGPICEQVIHVHQVSDLKFAISLQVALVQVLIVDLFLWDM